MGLCSTRRTWLHSSLYLNQTCMWICKSEPVFDNIIMLYITHVCLVCGVFAINCCSVLHACSIGGAESAGMEIAGLELDGPICRGGKCWNDEMQTLNSTSVWYKHSIRVKIRICSNNQTKHIAMKCPKNYILMKCTQTELYYWTSLLNTTVHRGNSDWVTFNDHFRQSKVEWLYM